MNRDPIGERGGRSLLRFVKNNPANRWDRVGLNPNLMGVKVDHVPQDPKDINPTFEDWSENPPIVKALLGEAETTGAITEYFDGDVKCWCECPEGQVGVERWFMRCKVSWSALIRMNKNWPEEKMEGAYGHEQKHVLSRAIVVDVLVVAPLSKRRGIFGDQPLCEATIPRYEKYAKEGLERALDNTRNNHRGAPSPYGNRESPTDGDLYDPVPGSPPIVKPQE